MISEIHCQPVSPQGTGIVENPDEEFVELLNVTTQAVSLFDPAHPTNRWRFAEGIAFEFPAAASLPPGAYALVVAFDPVANPAARSAFLAKYLVPAGTQMFGPFTGRLANEGETLELQQPDTPQLPPHPDAGFVPYVQVERIAYRTALPWAVGTAGAGLSLQRIEPSAYANDPLNWRAARPSPGRPPPHSGMDSDGDGLLDDWELAHGLDPDLATGQDGADGDPDGDGLANLREFQTGQSPREFSLVILAVRVQEQQLDLSFNAAAGRSYRLEWRRASMDGPWEAATNLLPSRTGELEFSLGLPPGLDAGFYRLVMP